MKRRIHPARGVSLIEALIAMAVMAFGMLALLGLQGVLRGNSDISKQRSEAVRFAQERVETLRAYSVLHAAPPVAGALTYDSVAAEGVTTVSLPAYVSSATFAREMQVDTVPPTAPSDAERYYLAPHKNVVVKVRWADRNNDQQLVQINTIVSRTAPEIVGAMTVAALGSAAQQNGARNINVPPGAVDLGDGTSRFSVPGAPSGTSWIFNNYTGFITKTCVVSACSTLDARLLSGYVRFAIGTSGPPSEADAESPPSAALPSVAVGMTVSVSSSSCFADAPASGYVAYFCAVPVTAGKWSGQSLVTLDGATAGGPRFASALASADGDYRVCRYTARRTNAVVPGFQNVDHPFNYLDVQTSLSNQNFLVIASKGAPASPAPPTPAVAYDCPGGDSLPVSGRTWHHQPGA